MADRGGVRWEAAAPRQPGGPGEGLALPRISFSPSPRARGEGPGGEGGLGGPDPANRPRAARWRIGARGLRAALAGAAPLRDVLPFPVRPGPDGPRLRWVL